MRTLLILSAAAVLASCATWDKIMERRVNYEKCVAALTAGGVSQADAERVCKRLSERADGTQTLRDAL